LLRVKLRIGRRFAPSISGGAKSPALPPLYSGARHPESKRDSSTACPGASRKGKSAGHSARNDSAGEIRRQDAGAAAGGRASELKLRPGKGAGRGVHDRPVRRVKIETAAKWLVIVVIFGKTIACTNSLQNPHTQLCGSLDPELPSSFTPRHVSTLSVDRRCRARRSRPAIA
jgi:hypothetical protein